nr:reverse transcriptase domain-containing protein [Tanacetum cinerariifolium]
EVNEIRDERLARTANPLALVAQQQLVYHPQNHPTHYTQNSSTRSQQATTRNRGKEIVNSPPPIYDQEPTLVAKDDEMSKDKEIDKLMALISLSFKKIYKPTNNNLRTSSNTSRANQDNSPRINRGTGYDNQRIGNVAEARETVGTLVMQKSRIQCYNCKEYGHVARECKKPKRAKDATYHREKMLLYKRLKSNDFINEKKLFAHQETISILSQQREAQVKFHKSREDKELDKVIALENKVKVLDNIVYKTSQSVQTMNMLNSKCQTSFSKPKFLKKAQRANPRLYDIGCYNDNLTFVLAPKSEEVIRLEKESRSKLSDLIRPFDYEKLNNLYDLFVPQRKKSSAQKYFLERSRMSHTLVKNENSKESFKKQTTLLEKRMDESIPWDQKCKISKELFKIKKTTNLRNEISNFQQRFDESFHEAWDRYKDLLRACPHHGFTELHQLDTFYNALNPADQDSVNAQSVEIAKLTHAVNQQTSAVTTAMTAILKQFQATPPPASVKAVEEICVTCGGAHPYYQCLAAGGNAFPELRDNIQVYVLAAAVNYNQGNSVYRPPGMANQIRPSGSGSLPSNTVANPMGELKAITTRSGIVLDGPTVDERVEETLTEQDLCASINLMPLSVWKKLGLPELISTRMTLELANRSIFTPARIARDVFVLVVKFTFLADFVIVDYDSDPRVPLILGRPFLRIARALIGVHGEEMILRDGDERLTLNMGHDTSSYSNQPQKESINLINVFNDSSEDILEDLFSTNQPSGNPTFLSHPELTSLKVNYDTFDPEGDNILPEKLLDLDSTKDLHPSLHVNLLRSGSLPSNNVANPKGELKAITTRSGIVLDEPTVPTPPLFINLGEDERVEETLMDPDLSDELKCKALADLGASINLMPLSVWKKLAKITRDVFVSVGKFTFPADFVIVDYESDPRVPLILGRHFLRIARALIDVHGEEMILRDGDERLTLNMRHDTSSYSHQPQRESINLINVFNNSKKVRTDLIPTRMTLKLANRAICTPDGIARDVFILVADFVVVDFESDHRIPLILGRPFLRTARALIDVHGEEMIIRDGDERLTLIMKHDIASYSNHPHRESVNLINIFNVSSEDCLEVSVSNPTSGNPTFSLHKEITSPKVTHEIYVSEGCNVLSEELPDIDSFNDIHPHFDDDPLSDSTTYSSNSLLKEFTGELAHITYPPDYDDNLQFDIESDLKEIEFLLYQGRDSGLKDSIIQTDLANLDDYFVDPTPEMFTDEHAPDYSSPSRFDVYDDDFLEVESDADNVYDDPFDSKGEKIKVSKLLIDELDLLCDFLPYSEFDSFNSQDFSRDDDLPLPNNEDKVFNPGVLIQEKSVKIITRVAQEKKLAISKASLVFEDFDPPFYEPLFFKDVPKSMMLLPFSSENEEKVFKPGIYTSEKLIDLKQALRGRQPMLISILGNLRVFETKGPRVPILVSVGCQKPGHLAARLGCAETKVTTWDDLAFKLITPR